VEGQPFSRQLRFLYKKRKVILVENGTYVNGTVRGEFTGRIFTVNAKDALCPRWACAGNFTVGARSYPVFTEDGRLSEYEENLFRRPEFTVLVAEADMRDGESLHFSRGDVQFYLKTPTAEHVQRVIERAIDLAEKIEVAEEPLDLTLLPVPFHPLIPLIRKWAIYDDGDRSDLLTTASKPALSKMIEKVSPYLAAIDSYLDSFGKQPPTERPCALGTLAECVLEAEQQVAKG
jgi:hypothetical protein